MENKMIERDDAVRLLYSVINSGIVHDDLANALEEVAQCIAAENDGLHVWGVNSDDVAELYTSVRTDTDEYKAHCDLCDELYQRYHFVPSEYETAQETESIKEGMADEYPDSAE